MATFNFDDPRFKQHSPRVQKFLRLAHKGGMSEDQFVSGYITARGKTTGDGRRSRSPSDIRKIYQMLAKKFDFFTP